MKYLSKSKLGLVLTAMIGTSTVLGAAPVQFGIQQLGAHRALQSPAPSNQIVIPALPANPIPISTLPFDIVKTGYYQLTQNLMSAPGVEGIGVFASDVVLDLNGYRMSGNSFSGTTAIHVYVGDRLTVLNGQIVTWNGNGIEGVTEDTIVVGVEILSNAKHGLKLGNGVVVQDCKVNNNQLGGIIGSKLLISGTEVSGNNGHGIEGERDGLVVSQCDVSANTAFGIVADEPNPAKPGGNRCVIEDSQINDNAFGGMRLPSFAQVRSCFAADNGFKGIEVGPSSYVGHCVAVRNVTGILVGRASIVESCAVSSNTDGIHTGGGGSVTNCDAFDNVVGISVTGETVVADNRVSGNQGRGILALETANRIEGNHLARNAVGIEVQGPRNLIVRNSLDSNGVQMQIATDNIQGPFLKTKGFIDNTSPWANFDLSFPTTFP